MGRVLHTPAALLRGAFLVVFYIERDVVSSSGRTAALRFSCTAEIRSTLESGAEIKKRPRRGASHIKRHTLWKGFQLSAHLA